METKARLKSIAKSMKVVTFSIILALVMTLTVGTGENGSLNGKVVLAQTSAEKTENVKVVTKKVSVKIKRKTKYKKNKRLPVGKSYVEKKGRDGRAIQTRKLHYVDGKLVDTEIVSTKVKKKAIKRVVVKGAAKVKKLNRGKSSRPAVYVFEATAYTTGGSVGTVTASGRPAKVGHVAVDPRVIPLGTKLYIESMDGTKSYGYAIAADTGGAIKGRIVDLYFNTYRECIQFGRRNVRVYVLK